MPVEVLLTPQRDGDAWVHRLALWQDPTAPRTRSSRVKDFEVLASPSDAGDDFRPPVLDGRRSSSRRSNSSGFG